MHGRVSLQPGGTSANAAVWAAASGATARVHGRVGADVVGRLLRTELEVRGCGGGTRRRPRRTVRHDARRLRGRRAVDGGGPRSERSPGALRPPSRPRGGRGARVRLPAPPGCRPRGRARGDPPVPSRVGRRGGRVMAAGGVRRTRRVRRARFRSDRGLCERARGEGADLEGAVARRARPRRALPHGVCEARGRGSRDGPGRAAVRGDPAGGGGARPHGGGGCVRRRLALVARSWGRTRRTRSTAPAGPEPAWRQAHRCGRR